MDIAILILLSVSVVVLVVLLFLQLTQKNNKNEDDLKVYIQKEYDAFKSQLKDLSNETNSKNTKELYAFKDIILGQLETKLKEMNGLVERRLQGGFEQTDHTIKNVIERLAKIDEAQKNIESLSKEVVSLNHVLSDKKTRGIYGEVQLYQLLHAVFGEKEDLYKKQFKLSSGVLADAMVFAPEPLGNVAIDSKFPFENYSRMTNSENHATEREQAKKLFNSDVKKHIDAIASKYIIEGETSDQAIMFIPAEAIFAEITAHHEGLIEYANLKKVWLASPTTLFSTLTMIQVFVQNLKRDEQTKVIVDELNKLHVEFSRYGDRWEKLLRSIETVYKDTKQVSITSKNIKKKFELLNDAKIKEAQEIDLDVDEEEEIQDGYDS